MHPPSTDDALLTPVRRDISVLVTGLVGFSAFAELAEPEYVFATLSQYHNLVADAVEAEGGTVVDLAGDGVLVVFNALTAVTDGERRAIRAALSVQKRSPDLVSAWRKRGQNLGLKMSLSSGFATLGQVRAGTHTEYRAIGPTVNIAFWLERAASDGELLATERVANAAAQLAHAIPRPDVSLPAVQRQLRVFELRAI